MVNDGSDVVERLQRVKSRNGSNDSRTVLSYESNVPSSILTSTTCSIDGRAEDPSLVAKWSTPVQYYDYVLRDHIPK